MRKIVNRGALAVSIALLSSSCSDVSAPTVTSVTFEQHAATLWAGEALSTSVSVHQSNGEVVTEPSVTYTSSHPLIASVDTTGRIHAHAAGHATISAAVGSVADTLSVTVVWPPVRDVFFSRDSLLLSVGDTITTALYVYDVRSNLAIHAPLTYSSSDSSIATAYDPIASACPVATCNFDPSVAALGEGRAVITVRADNITDVLTVIVTRR